MKNYYGVIESRADPKQLGRVRVRVLGIHTEDKVLLPTADLPWATVLSHDGSNSGLGTTPSFYVEGTWVGMFMPTISPAARLVFPGTLTDNTIWS